MSFILNLIHSFIESSICMYAWTSIMLANGPEPVGAI